MNEEASAANEELTTINEELRQEIEQRREIDESLRRSEERFRTLAENIPDLIMRFDRDLRLVYVNRALLHWTQLSMEDLVGRMPVEVGVFREAALIFEKNARKALDSGQPLKYEYSSIWHGEKRFVDIQLEPDRDAEGKIQGLICISRDITEHKRYEESLRETTSRLAVLAMTAGELLKSQDPQKLVESLCREVMHRLDCHVFFNFLVDPSVGRLRLNACAGIPEAEAKRIEWLDFGVAVCGCAARDKRRIVAERIPETPDLRTELVKSYGVKAYACHPMIGPEGLLIGTLSFGTRSREVFSGEDLDLMQAVTDQVAAAMVRKQVEEELRKYKEGLEKIVHDRTAELQKSQEQLLHSQKMEALGQLAGGIAHDFNNMMQVVIGYAHYALRKLDFEHPLREKLEHIEFAAKSAAGLTHRLLAFGRKQILQPRVFSLNDLLFKIKPMLRQTIGEDIETSYVLQSELGYIKADPGEIEHTIMNMAVNARNAMPEGGMLIFQTANATLGEVNSGIKDPAPPGPYVMLSISDTGVGMSRDVMERIFEPFFTTRPFGSGSGLGLSSAYGTIRQSGGAIRVYSEPGKGTTFKIFLPRCEETPQTEKSIKARLSSAEKGKTVLVVEDNVMALELASIELFDMGHHVLSARNGNEAVSLSRGYPAPIHLLLTDVVLPGLSGWDVSKTLSSERPEMETLYMSGYDEDNIIQRGKLVPGARLLTKPFSPEQLAAAINEALSSKKPEGCDYLEADVVTEATVRGKSAQRILVVDDEPGIADIIADVLREPGNKVMAAEDGSTAIAIASEFKPDLVLLDIKLPDMDGYELSRRIRDLSDGFAPFIIATSGYSPDRQSALEAFDAYVAKPVDFERLKELIADHAAGNIKRQ